MGQSVYGRVLRSVLHASSVGAANDNFALQDHARIFVQKWALVFVGESEPLKRFHDLYMRLKMQVRSLDLACRIQMLRALRPLYSWIFQGVTFPPLSRSQSVDFIQLDIPPMTMPKESPPTEVVR